MNWFNLFKPLEKGSIGDISGIDFLIMSMKHYTVRYSFINSLTTKMQMTEFSSAKFQKMLSPSYIILRIERLENASSVDLDEVAHYEPPYQDLRCLQIQLFHL